VPIDLISLIGNDKRKLFVGIGNVLKRDDGIGVYIARRIVERDTIKVLIVEASIENYIGKINSLPHDVLILIDAVNFGQKPGYYSVLAPEEILDYTTNTHNISIPKLLGFFKSKVLILGIQPKSVSLGEKISDPIRKQADHMLKMINESR